jgi:hypothetical protein
LPLALSLQHGTVPSSSSCRTRLCRKSVDVPLSGSQCGVGIGRTIAWTAQTAEGVGEPGVKLNGERHCDHRRSLWCDELEAMLIYSMSVSVDGFIADREGVRVDGP